MNGWLLTIVGLIYLTVAMNYFRDGQTGMGIAFVCYAGANAGFILAGWRL